jgi:hypothetical protein
MSAPQLTQYIQGQGAVTADGLNTFLQTTNVVADLRSFIGVTGMTVQVRGQNTVNDGAGGTFYWNPLGVGPDDNLNIIVPFGAATGVWTRLTILVNVPSSQYFVLTGTVSTAFVVPVGARQLYVRMVGAGAGGGCWNGTENGGNGGTTVFKDVTCLGGIGGGFGNGVPTIGAGGAGGGASSTGSNGTGIAVIMRCAGGDGFSGTQVGAASAGGTNGTNGGGSFFGGGSGSISRPSFCWGAGGAGAFTNGATGQGSAGGGGAGEYAEFVITSPLATTYNYNCGTPGAGTTTGSINGSAGRQGVILVTAQF